MNPVGACGIGGASNVVLSRLRAFIGDAFRHRTGKQRRSNTSANATTKRRQQVANILLTRSGVEPYSAGVWIVKRASNISNVDFPSRMRQITATVSHGVNETRPAEIRYCCRSENSSSPRPAWIIFGPQPTQYRLPCENGSVDKREDALYRRLCALKYNQKRCRVRGRPVNIARKTRERNEYSVIDAPVHRPAAIAIKRGRSALSPVAPAWLRPASPAR